MGSGIQKNRGKEGDFLKGLASGKKQQEQDSQGKGNPVAFLEEGRKGFNRKGSGKTNDNGKSRNPL